jgi:hypothetical protein
VRLCFLTLLCDGIEDRPVEDTAYVLFRHDPIFRPEQDVHRDPCSSLVGAFPAGVLRELTFQSSCKPAKEVESTTLIPPHIVCTPHCQVVFTLRILLEDSLKPPLVQLSIHVVSTGATAVSIRVDVVQIDGEEWMRYVTRVGIVRRAYRHRDSSPETEGEVEAKSSEASVDVPWIDEAVTVGVPEVAVSLQRSTGIASRNFEAVILSRNRGLVSLEPPRIRRPVVRFRCLVS